MEGGGIVGYLKCEKCKEWHHDFTMSSYRQEAGGPIVGRVCAECGQGVTPEELAEREKAELAEFANEQQDYEMAHIDWDDIRRDE